MNLIGMGEGGGTTDEKVIMGVEEVEAGFMVRKGVWRDRVPVS